MVIDVLTIIIITIILAKGSPILLVDLKAQSVAKVALGGSWPLQRDFSSHIECNLNI